MLAKSGSERDSTVHVRCSRCGDIYLAPFKGSRCLTCGHQPGGLSPFALLTPLIYIVLGLGVAYLGLYSSGFWAHPPIATTPSYAPSALRATLAPRHKSPH